MLADECSINIKDINGIQHIVEEYNKKVVNGSLQEAVAAGACLEHALARMHREVMLKIDNIIDRLE